MCCLFVCVWAHVYVYLGTGLVTVSLTNYLIRYSPIMRYFTGITLYLLKKQH